MGDLSGNNNTGLFELTGKTMLVAILLLFFLVVFVFCLHLYAKWFWQHRREQNTTRRRRLSFAAGHQEITAVGGLNPSALRNIPVVLFDPKENKDGLELECAVCLCEVCEGEKIRFLPKCNHRFHVDCIDMWFHSHSTCPLCRNPVSESPTLQSILQPPTMADNSISSANNHSTQSPISFPTNVLFWASSSSMTPSSSSSSTSNNGMLMIDIPRQINEEEDENKLPIYTRLRSLTRLLSGGDRRVNPSSTPRNLDP